MSVPTMVSRTSPNSARMSTDTDTVQEASMSEAAEISEAGTPELNFATGLPGFPDAHRFVMVPWGDGDGPFSVLRGLDNDELEFLVATPDVFFPDYVVELNDDAAAKLGIEDPTDAMILLIITVGEDVVAATANLLGPIVVNHRTGAAAQVVLASSGYDVRTPLFPSA